MALKFNEEPFLVTDLPQDVISDIECVAQNHTVLDNCEIKNMKNMLTPLITKTDVHLYNSSASGVTDITENNNIQKSDMNEINNSSQSSDSVLHVNIQSGKWVPGGRGRPPKSAEKLLSKKLINGMSKSSKNLTDVYSFDSANSKNNCNEQVTNRTRSTRKPKPKVFLDYITENLLQKTSKCVNSESVASMNDENSNMSNINRKFVLSDNCAHVDFQNSREGLVSQLDSSKNQIDELISQLDSSKPQSEEFVAQQESIKRQSEFHMKTMKQSSSESDNSKEQEIKSSKVTKGNQRPLIVQGYKHSSSFKSGLNSSSVQRSRYGRLHKGPALSPDMELFPLKKKKTVANRLPLKSKQPVSSSIEMQPVTLSLPNTSFDVSASTAVADGSAGTLVKGITLKSSEVVSKPEAKMTGSATINGIFQNYKNLTESSTSQWLVGDLLWSKIPGHPFWPCMISYDPLQGIYKKSKSARDMKYHTVYHVQYFGDEAQHGWTLPLGTMPFEGIMKYECLVKQIQEETQKLKGNLRKKILAKYQVTPARKEAWNLSVKEAESALVMNRAQRKLAFTFEYITDHNIIKEITKQQEKMINVCLKRKHSSHNDGKNRKMAKTVLKCNQENVKVHEIQKEVINMTEDNITNIAKGNKKSKGHFSIFLLRHVDSVRQDNPDLCNADVEELLKMQWQAMNEQQKVRYTSRFSKKDLQGGKLKYEETKVKEDEQKQCESQNAQLSESSLENSKVTESNYHTINELSVVEETEPCSETAPRLERLCQMCEKTGGDVVCKGICQQSFHLDCLGVMKPQNYFVCDECISGKHTCFACKSSEPNVRKCTVSTCGKFYHEVCLKQYPLTARTEGRTIICPHHACLSCYIDNPKHPRSSRSRLLKCIRCPTAYHTGDRCIAAGSVSLSQSQIICSNHFEPKKGKQYQTHLNATWCFICSIGGSLICCEACPAAFHAECLEIQPPDGNYFCEDCASGKHPRYGDIVWVKLGCYRWWPAEICHPRNVPNNIQNKSHSVGEFPVRFFGSHDYYWTHRGRIFLFSEGDKGSRESAANRNLAKIFQKALEEANEAFHNWVCAKEAKIAQEYERCIKPPPYKHIKANKQVGSVQIYSVDPSSINRCDCDPESDHPCSSFSDCLNRMMMVECHSSVCRAGDHCQNQRFQKRQYVPAAPFKTEGRGWGLKALEDIKKGQFVNEYVGDLINEEECQRRLKRMHEENDTNFYFLTLDKDRIIDAGPRGNLSRFMNHSCQPNCETQKWLVNGDTRVGLFAICDIASGCELTFNYNLDVRGNEKTKCVCGAANCSGYIGVRPKTLAAADQEKKIKETTVKKKKRKSQIVRKHEDECFRCGEGGELVMCDRKGCPKAYHLNCLGLAKPPHGRWECPWHHCDICGRPSMSLCFLCPNSFCQNHNEHSNISVLNSGQLVCTEHTENELEHITEANDSSMCQEQNSNAN